MAAGIDIQRVEVDGVVVSAGKPNDNGEPNEWDTVLPE